ncbi:hypothetical protein [Sphingobacterium sp. LRF_L2]|uniref:hypothetical protein n=1 Tax=Sphingobacterium sp. LRF_L2 TaxID=3369421 RepID=UPI003F648546
MKGILVIFLGLFSLFAIDLHAVRSQFEEAKNSKEATEKLYISLRDYKKNDPLLLAYKGASLTLKARYLSEREKKKEMVMQGIHLLENAVKTSPNQLEIRLIRLAVQEHSPKILKYKKNIDEDKHIILAKFEEQSSEVKSLVRSYMKQSSVFSAEEQKKIAH